MATPTKKLPTPQQRQQHHNHHRLSFVCVNDVYSFDDVDSSNAPNSHPRGGWCRAATLIKRIVRQKKHQGERIIDREDITADSAATAAHDVDGANTTVLTVVNGDVLGGSSLLQSRQGAAAIEVMNSIPIDLAVLGNHEFDHGDEILMQRVQESNFAWLGSNVYYPSFHMNSDDHGGFTNNNPFRQEKVDYNYTTAAHCQNYYFPGIHGNGKLYPLPGSGIKVGLFGLVTKVTPLISYPSKKVIFDPDILTVARRVTRSLRARGAQIIVAITHLSEAEDRMLAMDSISGVDLILGGHEHEPLAVMVHRNHQYNDAENGEGVDRGNHDGGQHVHTNILHPETNNQDRNEGGVLVFKCGMNAYWVGSVDLDIMIGEDDVVSSISTSWSMDAVNSRTAEDATVSKIVKTHRTESEASALISNFGESLASTIHLDDIIATVRDGHNSDVVTAHSSTLPLDTRMSSVRRHEATGGNLIADAMFWMLQTNIHVPIGIAHNNSSNDNAASSLPMLAMINGGFIRGDTLYQPGSAISVRDVLKELPFPHCMQVLEMSGVYLKEAILQQLKGSSNGPTGAYPHLSSNACLRYGLGGGDGSISSTLSSELEDGSEKYNIHSFTVNGVQVHDEQKYIIAVTTFVADGNEGCTAWLQGKRIANPAWTDVNMSCVLLKYLQCHGVIYPVLEGRVVLLTG